MNYYEFVRLGAPEIVLVVTALAVLSAGLIRQRVPGLCSGIAAAGILFAAATVLRLPAHGTLGHDMLVVSPLNSLFQVICLALAFFTIILAHGREPLPHHGEFLALLLLATVGLLLLIGSEELLMIFIGLELLGLSLYILTAFDKTDRLAAEAGLKYFLFGSVASAFTLFGISLLYGITGTTSLGLMGPQLAAHAREPLLLLGVIMTLVGFVFKIAGAPFHLWAPDTYQAAPLPAAAFIASGSKVASFVVLGKIVLVALHSVPGSAGWHGFAAGWSPLLAVIAALSILIGNLVALTQRNVRRLLAYSAVAHTGYTLLGLVAGPDGFAATLFYTTIYAITLVGTFGVVGFVRRENGGEDLADFAGLSARSPLLAGCMTIFVLSLAGLPPLAGFFGKFYLFSAALRTLGAGHGLLWLVVVALFGSLVSLYYYLLILKAIFVDQSHTSGFAYRVDPLHRLALLLLAAAIVFLGVLPGALVERILASFS